MDFVENRVALASSLIAVRNCLRRPTLSFGVALVYSNASHNFDWIGNDLPTSWLRQLTAESVMFCPDAVRMIPPVWSIFPLVYGIRGI